MSNTDHESDVIYLTADLCNYTNYLNGMRDIEYQLKRLSHIKPRAWYCDIIYDGPVVSQNKMATDLSWTILQRLNKITPNLPEDNYNIYINQKQTGHLLAREAMLKQMRGRGTKRVKLMRANNTDKNLLAGDSGGVVESRNLLLP